MDIETKTENAEKKTKQPKTVTCTFPIIRGASNTINVWLNGKKYTVKRGVEVTVPAGVKEIIDFAEKQASYNDSLEGGDIEI